MWDIKLSWIESVGLMEDFMILNCHAFDDPVCLRLFGTIRWIHNDSVYLIGVVERASLRTIYAVLGGACFTPSMMSSTVASGVLGLDTKLYTNGYYI